VSIIKKTSAARSSVQVIETNLENGSRKSFYVGVSNNSNASNPVTAGCNTWDPRLGGRTGGVEVSGDYVESHEGRKKDPAAARVVKEAILGKISNAAAGIRQ
jgi:hypothetical protein